METARESLAAAKKNTAETVKRVDELTCLEQREKQRLAQVSQAFNEYTEADIKACYERVADVQVALGVEREKERRFLEQRDRLEKRLKYMKNILDRAERMTMAVGSVLTFLSSQITGVVGKMEAVQKDKLVGASIIRAQEEERYRLSREIHDGPAQDMANLIFQTSICEKLIERDPEECRRGIQELRRQIKDCLSSLRQVIFDMRPMSIDDLGLAPALRQLAEKLAERRLISVELIQEGTAYPLPKHQEIALFRIVQEAINNVLHHAEVKKAKVRLKYLPTSFSVIVEDAGKGFDPAALADQSEEDGPGHYGLLGMGERSKIIGARFDVVSAPGRGTKVQILLPLAADKEEKNAPRKRPSP